MRLAYPVMTTSPENGTFPTFQSSSVAEPLKLDVLENSRSADARTPQAPGKAAAGAFASVTAADARGWFGDCGYRVH